MRGRIDLQNSPAPDRVMTLLKLVQQNGTLPMDEVALYGAQIHAVLGGTEQDRTSIRAILDAEHVPVTSLEWIEPTLEDVFISAINNQPFTA